MRSCFISSRHPGLSSDILSNTVIRISLSRLRTWTIQTSILHVWGNHSRQHHIKWLFTYFFVLYSIQTSFQSQIIVSVGDICTAYKACLMDGFCSVFGVFSGRWAAVCHDRLGCVRVHKEALLERVVRSRSCGQPNACPLTPSVRKRSKKKYEGVRR